ncbi:MAG: hypothetical protein Q8R95_09095 [Azonexus sp.]|nr:hypothetical protein [Azonexus sp.]
MLNRLKSALFGNSKTVLTELALTEQQIDQKGLPHSIPPDRTETIKAALAWLCAAQDHSASADGGVARDYSLIKGGPY